MKVLLEYGEKVVEGEEGVVIEATGFLAG